MADAVLSALLQVLFQNLASPLLDEVGLQLGVTEKLEKLSRILLRIRAVLSDAEERQIGEEAVKIWVRDLKDVAYDADDILDEFNTDVLRLNQAKEIQTGKDKVRGCLSSFTSNTVSFPQIAHKINNIMTKLDDIAKERDGLHLRQEIGRRQIGIGDRPQTSSLIDESCVFGRQDDKDKVKKLLVSDAYKGNDVSVIPIVGMGGIGKTTLAQLVYNDEEVKDHFDLRMWVCVSEELDVRRLTKAIIESATRKAFDLMDLDPLQVGVREIIGKKKFLLVLDDVWNESRDDWDALRAPLKFGARGSKILVTTRSEIVSSIMGTVPAHHLEGLSSVDCWKLIKQRAFANCSLDAHPNLVAIGQEIVKKCQGLPLAARSFGRHLHSKFEQKEWNIILKSKIWDLMNDKDDIFPTLRLSYHNLPAHLKQCFAYCSLFPKDREFEKEKLVQLWIAEGFIQPKGGKLMDEIGNEYFDELLLRSFFQHLHGNHLNDHPRYKMHSFIHYLSQHISGDECFRMVDNKTCNISKKARHASVLCDHLEPTMFETFYRSKSLRTFLLLRECPTIEQVPHDLFIKLKCLRVLDLSFSHISELPNSIDNLKHLRYLNLSNTRIKSLPESTSNLYNLQTLILRNCSQLQELPEDTRNLINLCHLDISYKFSSFNLVATISKLTSMPPGIGKLTSLRTLSRFIVGKESGYGIGELKNLMKLTGQIRISKLENVMTKEEAKKAKLKKKQHLHKLELRWSDGYANLQDEVKEVLEGLQPHTNLKELSIENYGGAQFPSWIGEPSFSNLVKMILFYCKNCDFLPPLGQLPFLKDLHVCGMYGVIHVGSEFYGEGPVKGFPSLEKLKFRDMPNLEEWSRIVEEREFPCFHELTIRYCPKLREFPDLPLTLTNLEVADCAGLTTLPRLPTLSRLVLEGCNEMILSSLPNLTSLSSLKISYFPHLSRLPPNLPCLCQLTIWNCPNLTELQLFPPTLTKLEIRRSEGLTSLPRFSSLRDLVLDGCHVDILRSLPFLTSLSSLRISDFPMLISPFEGLQELISLKHLEIRDCSELISLPEGLPSKLTYFQIYDCASLVALPDGIKNLTSLKDLIIQGCDQLTSLPKELQKLNSLEHLEIWNCPLLPSLPQEGLPATLQFLSIRQCPLLKQQSQNEESEDWHNMIEIPDVWIDDERFFPSQNFF